MLSAIGAELCLDTCCRMYIMGMVRVLKGTCPNLHVHARRQHAVSVLSV